MDTPTINEKPKETPSPSDNDKTFNRLQGLQILLKKESALKDLFIHSREETKRKIEDSM